MLHLKTALEPASEPAPESSAEPVLNPKVFGTPKTKREISPLKLRK